MEEQFSQSAVNANDGIVEFAKQAPSPNFDERPPQIQTEVIIVHAISLPPGQYGGDDIEALFCNRLDINAHSYYGQLENLRVSAHLLVRRQGQIIQFVNLRKRAWHAGESFCLGRNKVNDFSIGIELEGCDDDGFEEAQYASLNRLIEYSMERFPLISRDRIFGHSQIAPDRKTDPGPHFDWSRVR